MAFPRKKATFKAWEHQIAEMACLVTAFPYVPAHFNSPKHGRICSNLWKNRL